MLWNFERGLDMKNDFLSQRDIKNINRIFFDKKD